ncbi:thioesterase family protein [Flexibacterium corallicola]|uniref:thioesterase family protein n=1 Tax=Flexibacterium corallicola TaxID=3037259 RepID=UPI00286EE6BF|nr:thioesterase family protein [Pseudovibrio sp. M1P-2-3]
MRLWFRLLLYIFKLPFYKAFTHADEVSRLNFRVLPSDLDTNFHLNNGQYLVMMDYGRLDLTVRSGLWKVIWKNKWTPVVSGASIRFRRELRLWEPFVMETKLAYWDGPTAVMEQRLRFRKGQKKGAIASTALFKVGIYDRANRTFVPFQDIVKMSGHTLPQPELKDHIRDFLATNESFQQYDRQDSTALKPADQKEPSNSHE